jgi:hypothetical protein
MVVRISITLVQHSPCCHACSNIQLIDAHIGDDVSDALGHLGAKVSGAKKLVDANALCTTVTEDSFVRHLNWI